MFIDDADVCDGGVVLEMGQGAVVRCDDVVASLGFDGDAATGGANAMIDDGYKDCACGPVVDGLQEAIGAFPDVKLRDLVCQVVNTNIAVNRVDNAVHSAYCSVANAKIRLQNK